MSVPLTDDLRAWWDCHGEEVMAVLRHRRPVQEAAEATGTTVAYVRRAIVAARLRIAALGRKPPSCLGVHRSSSFGRIPANKPSQHIRGILDRFDAGDTMLSIAKDLACTPESIRQIVDRWGRKPRREQRRRVIGPQVERAEHVVRACWRDPYWDINQIAARAGAPYPRWIKRIAAEHGFPMSARPSQADLREARIVMRALFGLRVRIALLGADLSVSEAARRVGAKQTHLSYILTGRRSGSPLAHRLAKATGIDVAWLATGISPPPILGADALSGAVLMERARAARIRLPAALTGQMADLHDRQQAGAAPPCPTAPLRRPAGARRSA